LAAELVDGADQPDGTVSWTAPPFVPPAAAVYVNVREFPPLPATTLAGDAAIEPEPSAAAVLNVAVTSCSLFSIEKLQLPPDAACVHGVMPWEAPLQAPNVELLAGVAAIVPVSVFPSETAHVFSHVVLAFGSVASVTATEPAPAMVIAIFFAAAV
jgi:hypothetical protein